MISRRIHELEEILSATLFVKSTRKMSLTDAAKPSTSTARALSDRNEGVLIVNSLYGKPSGTLRVSAVRGFAETVLMPLAPAFLERYPELRLNLTMNVVPVNLVEAGMDVVIRSGTVLDESSYDHCDIAPVHHLICAAPAYFKAHDIPQEPKDLLEFNCLTHTFYASKEWWLKGQPPDFCLPVQGTFEVNNSEALRVAAVGGLGIARLPTCVAAKDI